MRNPFIDIKQNLLDSKERVINYQGSDLANQIHDELNKKVDDQVLQIMLYGAYNAGKSTFVNALIGEECANVGEIPTTDSVDTFDWNGYRLLDTPGVNAPIDHEETTIAQIKRTHVMVFFIRDGDQDTKDVYERLFNMLNLGKHIFIVLNHQLASEEDKATAHQKVLQILVKLAPQYGVSDETIQQIKVIPMNTQTALKGRLKNDHAKLLEHSGYSHFIEAFIDWLKDKDSKDSHLAGLKSTVKELWYKPVIEQLSSRDDCHLDSELNMARDDKTMLSSRQRALTSESRNFLNHELTLIKSDISNVLQNSSNQAQLDSAIQSAVDPIGDKLEQWLNDKIGEVSSSMRVSISHEMEQLLSGNNNKYLDMGVEGLGKIANADNIKGALLQGRKFKIPGLKGRWETTLGKWAGKAAVVVQVITALYDLYKSNSEEKAENERNRNASIQLYQAVEDVCATVKREYGDISEQVITQMIGLRIQALDDKIAKLTTEQGEYQKDYQALLDCQADLEQINY
ncbi:GTPase [Photobacterium sanguinicancri]|uniref:G domain-containing protein n=1 Tax=Photobacterium sanguinicancri TaxID=875932 RepID=A0ABX4FWH3_9GAMM|nr:GTPase [Photobacterium sanguinicancri]OZS43159.1 hypothetical protein ASV53_14625 [Photobacterium sanguinicancri]